MAYCRSMAEHAYALDDTQTPEEWGRLAEAVEEEGQVIYLTRAGHRVAAVVPAEVAAVGKAAMEAMEDAELSEAVRTARVEIAGGAETFPWEQVKAEAGW